MLYNARIVQRPEDKVTPTHITILWQGHYSASRTPGILHGEELVGTVAAGDKLFSEILSRRDPSERHTIVAPPGAFSETRSNPCHAH